MELFVFLAAMFLIGAIVLYALRFKGDVKAAFKISFVEFSLETKDKNSPSKSIEATRNAVRSQQDSPVRISSAQGPSRRER